MRVFREVVCICGVGLKEWVALRRRMSGKEAKRETATVSRRLFVHGPDSGASLLGSETSIEECSVSAQFRDVDLSSSLASTSIGSTAASDPHNKNQTGCC